MSTRLLVILIILAFLLGVGGVVVLQGNLLPGSQKPTSPKPTPTTSRPAPVAITTARGTVVSVGEESISVNVKNQTQTFMLARSVDVQRLTSGTLEKGDAKTEKAAISDLRVGQEVLVVVNRGTTQARSILIIKE